MSWQEHVVHTHAEPNENAPRQTTMKEGATFVEPPGNGGNVPFLPLLAPNKPPEHLAG
jgi:hypothetical protein